MKQKKQVLAVVAGPYRFYQVLWLYTQFPQYEWSILLLPYGNGDKVSSDIHEKCNKLGIFKKIYHYDMIGQDSNLLKQAFMFFKMFWYYILGKKKTLMKKIILSQTKGNKFDVFFVGCEYSIIEGAIIGLADEKEVYIFEEGMSDYIPRKKNPSFNLKEIICFTLTKMGYFSPYRYFEMENIKFCIKYSSLPKLLKSREYKEKRILLENRTDEFKKIIENTFEFDLKILEEREVILFTAVLQEIAKEKSSEYIEKIHQWLVKNCDGKKILIKKHPRDEEEYAWDDVDCIVWDNNIPAEVFLGMVSQQEILMMEMSTLLIYILKMNNKITIFSANDIDEKYKYSVKNIKVMLEISDENIVNI